MTNADIAKALRQTATLMQIAGENAFKARAYDKAADAVKKAPFDVGPLAQQGQAIELEGVGKSMQNAIQALVERGSFEKLDELKARIPEGVVELSRVPGLGPKKLQQLWEELAIDSLEKLQDAIAHGYLLDVKGFGQKTVEALKQGLEYKMMARGQRRINQGQEVYDALKARLEKLTGVQAVHCTGELRRACPVIAQLGLLVVAEGDIPLQEALNGLDSLQTILELPPHATAGLSGLWEGDFPVQVVLVPPAAAGSLRALLSAPEGPLKDKLKTVTEAHTDEQAHFQAAGLKFIQPELWDAPGALKMAEKGNAPALLQREELTGILHAHSTWSDGGATLEEMARACLAKGYTYLGITDHSQTAAYAGGLRPERVREQWAEIDALNEQLVPEGFRIFKGIESDILQDGSLDYSDELLAGFDFIVASIHGQMRMTEEEATERLIKAVMHPATRILGHPTGRLLLTRPGYPINHEAVLDACAEHKVGVEINASPHRLDLDWTWIAAALERGVPLSVNPDAHSIPGIDDVAWGTKVARKGGLTAEHCLNAWPADKLAAWFARKG